MTTLDRFSASSSACLILFFAMQGCSRKADKEVEVATDVPISQSADVGPTLTVEAFALLAGNSVRLQASSNVVGGHVGARGVAGPFLTSGFATAVGSSVKLDVKSVVAGESVQLGKSAIVGAVQTNRLVDLGAIKGAVSPLTPLPQLPGTQRVTPGTNALTLTGNQTLNPGTFGTVSVSGKLTLQPGTYSMQSLQIANSAIVQAQGQVKVLIAGKISIGTSVRLTAPTASSFRIESSAVDGTGGTLGEQPPAVSIGASTVIQALLTSPNGTLAFGTSVVATGAFAARDIDVGPSAKVVWQGGITGACPLSCDDGNPCTSDACGSNGVCTHAATADGFPCNDNNMCTLTDSCQSGVCVGSDPVSCATAVQCRDAGVCDPATGTCSQTSITIPDAGAPPVGRDPTLVDLDRLRIGAARLGTSCRSVINAPLGKIVSGSVMFDVSDPSLSQVAASQLACVLDMPPGSSCDALRACRVGSVVPPSSLPICVGSDLVTKNKGGIAARVDCTKFGGTCFTTDLGAICGLGPCQPGETYGCDGRATTACVHGIRSRAPCGQGRICGERNDHLIDCIGAGAACTGGDRCDGAKAVRCVPEGGGVGHEAVTDCGSMGMGCVLADPTKEAVCVPIAGACNPTQDFAYCTGGDINLCVLNQWWTVSCSSISASGRCAIGAGVNGEAACL